MMNKLFPLFLAGFFGCAARQQVPAPASNQSNELLSQFIGCAKENYDDVSMDEKRKNFIFCTKGALVDYIPTYALIYESQLEYSPKRIEIIGRLFSKTIFYIDDKNANGKIDKNEKAFYMGLGQRKRMTTQDYEEIMQDIIKYWGSGKEQKLQKLDNEINRRRIIFEG